MAMLGKRFQRTISMSQIGPGSNLHSDKGQAAHASSSNPPPSSADPAAKLPLIRQDAPQMANEQLHLQVTAHPWEALKARGKPEDYQHHHLQSHHHRHASQQSTAPRPWGPLKASQQGDRPAAKQQEQLSSSPNQWDLLKSAEAKMMAMMQHSGVPVSNDHLGNWPQFSSPSSSPLSLPPSHFLDACFLCKRHLWQERDIFIYRGDKAFCSEECRHRQMLTDEALSMRASRN